MMDCSPKVITLSQPLKGVRLRGDAASEERRERDLREARQNGYDAAVAEMHAQVSDQREALAKLQDEILRRLGEQEKQLLEELHTALPDLVVEGVSRVLSQVELDRPVVERIVRSILEEQAPDREGLTIFLSPRDCKLMEGLRDELDVQYPNIELKADETLSPGDCLVRGRFGVTDARLDTKLKNLREALA